MVAEQKGAICICASANDKGEKNEIHGGIERKGITRQDVPGYRHVFFVKIVE